ncbi:MAG: kinase-like domain-containing protein [Linnemannia gamsii]|nr:MAG: kinase-like domain-containing protein [Linnemannia gamsii]
MAQRRIPPVFIDPSTNEEYRVLQQLSLRMSGTVFKAVGPQGDVALKAWYPGYQHMFHNDNNTRSRFQHRGVLSIRAIFQHEEYFCQVLPWCAKQSVRDVAETKDGGKFDGLEARAILQQVAVVMAAMHKKDQVHGSIQPSNILLDGEGRVRVNDFCLAQRNVHSVTALIGGRRGNRTYLPPERLVTPHLYGKGADAWAFGTLMFEMLVGHPPKRNGKTQEVVFGSDIRGLSQPAFDLIKGLLLPNPYKRLDFPMVLQHPFIRGHNGEHRPKRGQDQGAGKPKKKERQQEASQVTDTAIQGQAETAEAASTALDELTTEELIAFLITPTGDLSQ